MSSVAGAVVEEGFDVGKTLGTLSSLVSGGFKVFDFFKGGGSDIGDLIKALPTQMREIFKQVLTEAKIKDSIACTENVISFLSIEYHNAQQSGATKQALHDKLNLDTAENHGGALFIELEKRIEEMNQWANEPASGLRDLSLQAISLYLTMVNLYLMFYQEMARQSPTDLKNDIIGRATKYTNEANTLIKTFHDARINCVDGVINSPKKESKRFCYGFYDSWLTDTNIVYACSYKNEAVGNHGRSIQVDVDSTGALALIRSIHENQVKLLNSGSDTDFKALKQDVQNTSYRNSTVSNYAGNYLGKVREFGKWYASCKSTVANIEKLKTNPLPDTDIAQRMPNIEFSFNGDGSWQRPQGSRTITAPIADGIFYPVYILEKHWQSGHHEPWAWGFTYSTDGNLRVIYGHWLREQGGFDGSELESEPITLDINNLSQMAEIKGYNKSVNDPSNHYIWARARFVFDSTPVVRGFDPGNWTAPVPNGDSIRWVAGYKVRYRVSFYGPEGQSHPGPWWNPSYGDGADLEGYYSGGTWACPTLTDISTDATGKATARIVYRQFFGKSEEVAGIIWNNTDTRYLDNTDEPTINLPTNAPELKSDGWQTSVLNPSSTHWVTGYKVRYAVGFYNEHGSSLMSPWWSPAGADAEGYYNGGTKAHPTLTNIATDPTGKATERIIYRQFFGHPVEIVGRVQGNAPAEFVDNHESAVYCHPLTAPIFDPGNWAGTAGAFGTSGRWVPGYKVRYRVAFYNDDATLMGPWWHPSAYPGSDAEGYFGGDRWACPTLTNIPTDPSGQATGRIIYRQFKGRDVEAIAVIPNNTETRFLDDKDIPDYGPPASAPEFDPGNWTSGPSSTKWVSGYKVRYAVSFYASAGETKRGLWWHPTDWVGSDADGYYGERWHYPLLINIPIDPSGKATGRRIYRQFLGHAVEVVGEIADNTTTAFQDLKP